MISPNNLDLNYKITFLLIFLILPQSIVTSGEVWVLGAWSGCTGLCGNGYRFRTVDCMIKLDFSGIFNNIEEEECPKPKPPDRQTCTPDGCLEPLGEPSAFHSSSTMKPPKWFGPIPTKPISGFYFWRISGFSECSADCLGGIQEEIIECIRYPDKMIVHPRNCNLDEKPDAITKTCNDKPCSPRWNISDFGPCTVPCGFGIQARQVNCIHEITRGSENTLNVSDSLCNGTKPVEERVCKVRDCPSVPKETVDDKCVGKKCLEKYYSFNRVAKCKKGSRSSSSTNTGKCNKKKSHCKNGNCKPGVGDNSVDSGLNRSNKKNSNLSKVSLKVGGTAVIEEGTIVKVRCPLHYLSDGEPIPNQWKKDGIPIEEYDRRRFSVTRFGALKIDKIKHDDKGSLSCQSGNKTLTLNVKVIDYKLRPEDEDKVFHYATVNYNSNKEESNKTSDENNLTGEIRPEPPYEIDPGSQETVMRILYEKLKKKGRQGNVRKSNVTTTKNFHGVDNSIETKGIYFADQQSNGNDSERFKSSKFGDPSSALEETTDNPSKMYEWIVGPWSNCSAKCGNIGFEVRAVECLKKSSNISIITKDANECSNWLSEKPISWRTCNPGMCPKWKVGEWSECTGCEDAFASRRYRDVTCKNDERTFPESECASRIPPLKWERCYNPECAPKWITGNWTMCSGTCGKEGEQTRSITCVYGPNNVPATSDLQCHEDKPKVNRKCKVECKFEPDCKNSSFLCKYAKTESCSNSNFAEACCETCSNYERVNRNAKYKQNRFIWDPFKMDE